MTRVRWRVVLPAGVLIVSVLLMLLAQKQQPMLRRMGTGWEVPARVINSVINGPGFYLTGFIPAPMPNALDSHLNYDGDRLLGIVLFWFLIGLALDRRGTGRYIGERHPIPVGILFTFGALVCGLFGIGLGAAKLGDATPWKVIAEHSLRSEDSMVLTFVIWLLALGGYFLRRALVLARHSV